MERREFITFLGGAAAAPSCLWPRTAHAQQAGGMRRIGWLGGGAADDALQQASIRALQDALAKLGWVESRNLRIDLRFGAGNYRLLGKLLPPAARTSNAIREDPLMAGFLCSTCGQFHDEPPLCFGPLAPDAWMDLPEAERETRGQISSDSCVIDGTQFFILGRIVLPINDHPEPFVWLAWVSLSEKNFERAGELWHVEGREQEPACFGWLQSSLPYQPGTLNLKTMVHTQPVGERPIIELEPTDHPLAVAQREGITLRQAHQIAERMLHGDAP